MDWETISRNFVPVPRARVDEPAVWFEFSDYLSVEEQKVIMSLNCERIVFVESVEKPFFYLGFKHGDGSEIVELLNRHKMEFRLSGGYKSGTMKILKINGILWPTCQDSNLSIQQRVITCTSKTAGFAHYHIRPNPVNVTIITCEELKSDIYKEFVIVICDNPKCDNPYCLKNERYTTLQSICPAFRKPSNQELVQYIMQNGYRLSSIYFKNDAWMMKWEFDNPEVVGHFKPRTVAPCEFDSKVMYYLQCPNIPREQKALRSELQAYTSSKEYIKVESKLLAYASEFKFDKADVQTKLHEFIYLIKENWSPRSRSNIYCEYDEYINSFSEHKKKRTWDEAFMHGPTFEGMVWIKYPIQNYIFTNHVSDEKFVQYRLFDEIILGFEPTEYSPLFHFKDALKKFEFIDRPPFHEKMKIIQIVNTSIKHFECEIDDALDRDLFVNLQVVTNLYKSELLLNLLEHYNINYLVRYCQDYTHNLSRFYKNIVVQCDHHYCKYGSKETNNLVKLNSPELFYKSFRYLSGDEIKETILSSRSFGFTGHPKQTYSYRVYPYTVVPHSCIPRPPRPSKAKHFPKYDMGFTKNSRSFFDEKKFMLDFLNDVDVRSNVDVENFYKAMNEYPTVKAMEFIYQTLFQTVKDLNKMQMSTNEFNGNRKNFSFVLDRLESIYDWIDKIHYKCETKQDISLVKKKLCQLKSVSINT